MTRAASLPVIPPAATSVSLGGVGDIFAPRFVEELFDEMAASYGLVNYVTSFGFCERWRRMCVDHLELSPGETVLDLMAGGGELWPYLLPRIGPAGKLVAIDFSAAMCRRAAAAARDWPDHRIEVRQQDVLAVRLPADSADALVAAFGLKTFDDAQQRAFARQIARTLKPGGRCSLIEVSSPEAWLLRGPYLAYLHHVVPVVGRLLLGNPENYRMLGRYTEAFRNCERMGEHLAAAGLEVAEYHDFFGCATGLVARKPS